MDACPFDLSTSRTSVRPHFILIIIVIHVNASSSKVAVVAFPPVVELFIHLSEWETSCIKTIKGAGQGTRSLLFRREGALTHLYPVLHVLVPKLASGAFSGKHMVPGPSQVIRQHFNPHASQLVTSKRRS